MHPSSPHEFISTRKSAFWYFFFTLFLLMAFGFAGYYFGFLGFIYKIMMPVEFGKFSLIILSIIFGIAAFFSPCSFTVLPAYVSHYLASDERKSERPLRRGLYFGFIAGLGVISVNLIIGLIIGVLGSTAPFAKDPREDIALILGIRIVAGFLIALMGIFAVFDRPIPTGFLQRIIAGISVEKSAFLYGFLYNGAAIGCTAPILLGLILYALTTGSFMNAFTSFVIFALTMGVLMILLTTAIAIFKKTMIQKVISYTPVIKKTAGWIMVITGLTIAILTLEGNRFFVKIFFPFLP